MAELEVLSRRDFTDVLGEAFHTAFRKAASSGEAAQIYRLIDGLSSDEWSSVLEFVADALDGSVMESSDGQE
jgi:hypothetical protein